MKLHVRASRLLRQAIVSDEDDEELKNGDSSYFCEEPFYFAKSLSKSFSKKYGVEVSRHGIVFVRGAPQLMCLWEGESQLVFGIGGHLRTVVDWYLVRGRNETAVSGWLPVSSRCAVVDQVYCYVWRGGGCGWYSSSRAQ